MIIVKDVTVKFGDKTVLDNFSYIFEDNTVTSIVGESGKGKTTLLRCIAGLIKPTDGKVFYNDKKVSKPIPDMFMMHQHYTNFPWKTCGENVLFPISIKRKITDEDYIQAESVLDMVGLLEYENKYPYELSGGMNQRLALARALITNPKVLLMDEPMSALDVGTRRKIQDLILDIHQKTNNTIIMITHDNNEANKMSDKILKI